MVLLLGYVKNIKETKLFETSRDTNREELKLRKKQRHFELASLQ